MILPYQFREQCEAISTDWRATLGLRAFDPLPAKRLAQEFHAIIIGIHELEVLPQDAVDYFISNGKFWAGTLSVDPLKILYNPSQSPARYETSIMEELSHVILKHPPEIISVDSPNGRKNFNAQVESEAKYLASCLKLPKRGLLWATQRKMVDVQIADHFGVSINIVQWRHNATKTK